MRLIVDYLRTLNLLYLLTSRWFFFPNICWSLIVNSHWLILTQGNLGAYIKEAFLQEEFVFVFGKNQWILLVNFSHVWLFATPWTVARQAPLSLEFSRQEYWSGLPFPSPGDLPDPGIKPGAPVLQVDSLPSEPLGKPPGKEDSVSSVHLNFLGNSFKIYKINISVSLPVQYCVDPCRVPWSHQLCAQLSCLVADQGSASWPAQVTTTFLCVHLWLLRLPFPMGSLLEASRTLFWPFRYGCREIPV